MFKPYDEDSLTKNQTSTQPDARSPIEIAAQKLIQQRRKADGTPVSNNESAATKTNPNPSGATIDAQKRAAYTSKYKNYSSIPKTEARDRRQRRQAQTSPTTKPAPVPQTTSRGLAARRLRRRAASNKLSAKGLIQGMSGRFTTLMMVSFMFTAYLWVQLPFAIANIASWGLYAAYANSFFLQIFSDVADAVEFVPLTATEMVGATMIVPILVGMFSILTAVLFYQMTGVAALSGRMKSLKWFFLIFSLPIYFFPFTNLLPWALFYMLVVFLFPR